APVGHLVFGQRVEGELCLAAALGVHQPQLPGAGAVTGEDDLGAVGGVLRVGVVADAGQLLWAAAVAGDDVDVAGRCAGRFGAEGDLAFVGRELREDRRPGQVGDLLLVGAVLLHRPHLHRTPTGAAAVGDSASVGRVGGAGVEAGVVG